MKHLNLILLTVPAAAASGLVLGYVFRKRFPERTRFRNSDLTPLNCLKAVLLTASAIASGGVLGYLLLVKLPGPLNMVVFSLACWEFGEMYYRIFLRIFRR